MLDTHRKRGRPATRAKYDAVPWQSLDRWLKTYNVTATRLSADIGVTKQVVYRWLSTSVAPDIKTLKQVCLSVCGSRDGCDSTTNEDVGKMFYDLIQDGTLTYDAEALRLLLSFVCPKRDAAAPMIQRLFFSRF